MKVNIQRQAFKLLFLKLFCAHAGCPEAKKQLFLRDLMDLMQKKMKASSTDSDEATDKWQASKEERVATWHFVMLDKNKNKVRAALGLSFLILFVYRNWRIFIVNISLRLQVLERKEWKSFRAMVANSRQLRRCGKKLPRYCDINNDRRISMTEWLSCLNAQRPTTGTLSFYLLFIRKQEIKITELDKQMLYMFLYL